MKELDPRLDGGVERDGNVARVIRPEGTYSLIYGMHVLPMDPDIVFADVALDISRLDLGIRDFRPFALEGLTGVVLAESFKNSI